MNKNRIKLLIVGMLLVGSFIGLSSCKKDILQLSPIDYYGSENYWKTPEHARAYIVGIHQHLRRQDWQHIMTFGELRGGAFSDKTTSSDAMTLQAGNIRMQNFSEEHHGVKVFGDLFGRITNLNLFIQRVDGIEGLPENEKNFYLAQVYGLRAFYYFELHRVYGGVPIRLGVEVVDGERDPNKLYLKRNSPKEVLDQVVADLNKSLELFGDNKSFNAFGLPAKNFWNKAATECLAADVALWSAKVTTHNAQADPSKIQVAKRHLLNVLNDYGLSLQNSFSSIFDTRNKGNSEIIFATQYLEGEASTSSSAFMYDLNTGNAKGQIREDGTPFNNPFGIVGGNQSYQYHDDLFLSYDVEDSRRLVTFFPAYSKKVYEETGKLELWGTFLAKNIGHINSAGDRIFDGDIIYYRLAWVYLALAEVANYEGDNAAVENYINAIRKRAYGENYAPAKHAYTAGSFTQNELAILREKDKEFVNEGQRWWDLRRMQFTKGGTHLVFKPEANFYQSGSGTQPILNEATEAYKVLWPINKGLIDNDPELYQTPGYESSRPHPGGWD